MAVGHPHPRLHLRVKIWMGAMTSEIRKDIQVDMHWLQHRQPPSVMIFVLHNPNVRLVGRLASLRGIATATVVTARFVCLTHHPHPPHRHPLPVGSKLQDNAQDIPT